MVFSIVYLNLLVEQLNEHIMFYQIEKKRV